MVSHRAGHTAEWGEGLPWKYWSNCKILFLLVCEILPVNSLIFCTLCSQASFRNLNILSNFLRLFYVFLRLNMNSTAKPRIKLTRCRTYHTRILEIGDTQKRVLKRQFRCDAGSPPPSATSSSPPPSATSCSPATTLATRWPSSYRGTRLAGSWLSTKTWASTRYNHLTFYNNINANNNNNSWLVFVKRQCERQHPPSYHDQTRISLLPTTTWAWTTSGPPWQ